MPPADAGDRLHDTEVFGPVATLMPYRDLAHALKLIARGQGSLVASLYGSDPRGAGRHRARTGGQCTAACT